jgi:branched-subunit amino acid transport protein
MSDTFLLVIFAGMGAATYIPRWFPLYYLSEKKLPPWIKTWLDFIPASILSALLLPVLLIGGEPRHIDLMRPELMVALPTFLFALKTKSLGGTVVVGMGLFWVVGKVVG